MQPTALSNTTAARIKFRVTVFALLIVTAVVYGGCSKQVTDNQNIPPGSPSPSPTATPAPSGTPEVMLPDDTIIVIKDNSLDIDINTKYCGRDTSGAYTYRCQNIELGDVIVTPYGGSPTTCPNIKPNSKITVAESTSAKDIKIKGHPGNPNLVTIKFDTGTYAECPTEGHHCGDNKHVKNVNSDTGGICRPCTPEEHCEIAIRRKMYAAPTSTTPVKK
jgi:hypothetical protein